VRSRSVLRREAAQRGQPAPDFSCGENQECGRCGLDVTAGIHVRPEDCIRALRAKLSTADACGVCGRCHAAPTMRCWTERDIARHEGEMRDLLRRLDETLALRPLAGGQPMNEAWNKQDRPCLPCMDCGAELYERFWGGGGWAKTDKVTGKAHSDRDCIVRLKVLREAGQACIDWARDTGECHLCGEFDGPAQRPHGDECPLLETAGARSKPAGGNMPDGGWEGNTFP
jgi:cytochrome c553